MSELIEKLLEEEYFRTERDREQSFTRLSYEIERAKRMTLHQIEVLNEWERLIGKHPERDCDCKPGWICPEHRRESAVSEHSTDEEDATTPEA